MSDAWALGGAAALQAHAPTAASALGGLVAAWPPSVSEVQLRTIRTVAGEAHGLVPLRLPPTGPRRHIEVPEPAVAAFAEQFAFDVGALGDGVRAGWLSFVGREANDPTLTVYVADFVPRVRAALDALFGDDGWYDGDLSRTLHSRLVLDEFLREVALLDAVDPVTTELVRLRGARQHRCRVCMARRSLAAVYAGADAHTFRAVDDYRASGLPAAQQAALALTDAIIWTPSRLRRADLDAVRELLTPAQAVEVVLDVMRNAANKIAVGLGTDAPEVAGIQLFEIDEEGAIQFP